METNNPPLTVLVVDDQKSACRWLKQMVMNIAPNSCVQAFNDPDEALQWAKEEQPHLSIIDYRMPSVDGGQFVKRLREQEASGTPSTIIIVTAIDDPSIDEQALAAGANHVVRKPVAHDDLSEILTRTAQSVVPEPDDRAVGG